MKKTLVALVPSLAVLLFAWHSLAGAAPKASAPAAKKGTYAATVYVAGHGGHFAKADVTIDPSSADAPIRIDALDMVPIGNTESHKTHDARIDSGDPGTLFWSTYALDKEGKLHVGKSDLKTGKVITDVALTP